MSGASVGCSQPAPCPGMTPLRRCRNRGEKKNVVFIDVDDDNVIFIDVPESSKRTFRASNAPRKHSKSPRTGVICLDDDENIDHNFTDSGVKNDANFNAGASSSMRSHTKSGGLGKSSDTIGDECEFIRENVHPFKLSKCKRTYSGKTSARNRYGMGTDSESCPSDSDTADCELMEDSFGRVREQWEKASLRRKCDTRNAQSGVGDPDMVFNDARQNVDGAHDCSERKEPLFKGTNGEGKDAPGPSVSKENGNVDFDDNGKQTCNEDDDYGLESILRRYFTPDKGDPLYRMNPFVNEPSSHYSEHISSRHFEQGGTSACREEQGPKGVSSFTCQEQNISQVPHMEKDFQGRQRNPPGEPCTSTNVSNAAKANFSKPCMSHSEDSVSNEPAKARSVFEDTEKFYQETTSNFNPHFQWNTYQELNTAEEKFASEQASTLKSESSDKHIDNDYSPNGGNDELVKDCIISEREKLKETEEYKRAIEEEMASRQRALQIQAEEAQRLRRLRKRLKAENIRLLDMERRQRQRVEEIRETQKKDEENMNLKEVIRAQVIKELHQLEVRCHDMASLLRGLGTFVSNSVNASQNEVRSAYKRALLTFHPDRASRYDIRQQVEAEEKFKLICRMKEKFLPI